MNVITTDINAAQAADLSQLAYAIIVDVRRRATFEHANTMLPNAIWRDPERVDEWAGELKKGQAVIVYCVHGHEVSQKVAATLQLCGINARYLRGGIEDWQASGNAVVTKAIA